MDFIGTSTGNDGEFYIRYMGKHLSYDGATGELKFKQPDFASSANGKKQHWKISSARTNPQLWGTKECRGCEEKCSTPFYQWTAGPAIRCPTDCGHSAANLPRDKVCKGYDGKEYP